MHQQPSLEIAVIIRESLDQNGSDWKIEDACFLILRVCPLWQINIAMLVGVIRKERIDQIISNHIGRWFPGRRILKQAII